MLLSRAGRAFPCGPSVADDVPPKDSMIAAVDRQALFNTEKRRRSHRCTARIPSVRSQRRKSSVAVVDDQFDRFDRLDFQIEALEFEALTTIALEVVVLFRKGFECDDLVVDV